LKFDLKSGSCRFQRSSNLMLNVDLHIKIKKRKSSCQNEREREKVWHMCDSLYVCYVIVCMCVKKFMIQSTK
jgi:hypothetical protein